MKKTVTLLSILLICIFFSSCGNSSGDKKPSAIELTPENIAEYLQFDFEYSDRYDSNSNDLFTETNVDMHHRTYAIKPGFFKDVEIQILYTNTKNWSLSTSDKNYNETYDGIFKCSFKLPADGRFDETHKLHYYASGYDKYTSHSLEKDLNYEIISVTGTFTPNY